MRCPNCNTTDHEDGAKFCYVCGHVLEDIPYSELISKGTMALRQETRYIIIHYSPAIKQYYGNDIGYHYIIDKNGVIHNGRPVNLEGLHSGVYNRYSISVCFECYERINEKQASKDAALLLLLLKITYRARTCFFDELTGQYNSFIYDYYRNVLVYKFSELFDEFIDACIDVHEDHLKRFKELCDRYKIPYTLDDE